jgi:hypothetical protein
MGIQHSTAITTTRGNASSQASRQHSRPMANKQAFSKIRISLMFANAFSYITMTKQ